MEVVNIERRQDVNQIEDYFMVMCLSEKREVSTPAYKKDDHFNILILLS